MGDWVSCFSLNTVLLPIKWEKVVKDSRIQGFKAADLIRDVKPNLSSLGNLAVIFLISNQADMAFERISVTCNSPSTSLESLNPWLLGPLGYHKLFWTAPKIPCFSLNSILYSCQVLNQMLFPNAAFRKPQPALNILGRFAGLVTSRPR